MSDQSKFQLDHLYAVMAADAFRTAFAYITAYRSIPAIALPRLQAAMDIGEERMTDPHTPEIEMHAFLHEVFTLRAQLFSGYIGVIELPVRHELIRRIHSMRHIATASGHKELYEEYRFNYPKNEPSI